MLPSLHPPACLFVGHRKTAQLASAVAVGCTAWSGAAAAQSFTSTRFVGRSVSSGAVSVLNTDDVSGRSSNPSSNPNVIYQQSGAGTIRFEGTGFGFNTNTVNGGIFLNETTDGVGTVTVNSAGTYTGTGLAETVVGSGRVNPGSVGGIGISQIADMHVQGVGSVLDIEFGSGGVDLLRVGNVADLNGGVNFIELDPGVTTGVAQPFLEIDPGGTPLTTQFSNTTTAFLTETAILSATVSYRAFGADVTFEPLAVASEFEGAQQLESGRAVGLLIDGISRGDRGDEATRTSLLPLVDALLQVEDVGRAVLTQANTPASAAVASVPDNQLLAANVALARLNLGSTLLGNRHGGLASRNADLLLAQGPGFGRATSSFSLLADAASGPVVAEKEPAALEALAATLPSAAGLVRSNASGPSLFAQAIGSFSDVDADSSAPAQDSQSYGVTFGGDWGIEEWNAVGGVFLAFTETDTGVDGLADSFSTDAFQLGVYGAKRFGSRVLLNATASASILSFESERPTSLGTAEGDANGFVLGLTSEALYDIPVAGRFVVSPLVGVEAFLVDRDGYRETGAGAFNLAVSDASAEFLTTVVGVQATTSLELESLGSLRLSPLVRVGWSRQHLDRSGTTTSAFAAAPSETFTTRSAARERDALRIAGGLELGAGRSDDWAMFARYTGDIASNGASHTVRAGLRFSF